MMPIRRHALARLALAVLATASLAACDDDSTGPTHTGRVRVLQAIANAPAAGVRVDDAAVAAFGTLNYKNAPQYVALPVGNHSFALRATGAAADIASVAAKAVGSNVDYTIVAAGRVPAVGTAAVDPRLLYLVSDAAPAAGKSSLHVVQAAAGAQGVDVYVTAADADLATATPTFTNVAFGAASAWKNDLTAGTYRVRVTTAGTKTVLIDQATFTIAAGQARTLVAVGDPTVTAAATLSLVTLADTN